MDQDDIVVACDCGFTSQGPEADVIEATKQHGRQVHNMDVTDEQVLAMAKPTAERS